MRLLNQRKKTYSVKHYSGVTRDSEGNREATYSNYEDIRAEIFDSKSDIQAEMYGERIHRIKNMLCDSDVELNLKDVVLVDGVEYEAINKETYAAHIKVVLEKK